MNAENCPSNPVVERWSGRTRSLGSRKGAPAETLPDQVVTLASLSQRIPGEFIGEQLAAALYRETGASVLLLQLQQGDATFSLRHWGKMAPRVNGEFGLGNHLVADRSGFSSLRVRVGGGVTEAGHLPSFLDHARRHFRYIIINGGAELAVPVLIESLARSDRAFLLLQPTAENLYHRELLIREVRSHPRHENLHLKTIACRESGEQHYNALLQQMGAAIHGFIHGCPSAESAAGIRQWTEPTFGADIRRLAREIGRCRVGLALSSGGARGLAHIGVIQVFEENGIEIDVVAGCSMGAYVGAVWGYGYDGQFMEKLARQVEHRWGLLELIDPFILPRQGFLRGEKVKHRLKKSIGDVHFSELVRPLRIVATNLRTLERAVFSTGEVAAAVHASSAIPGACAPVQLNGEVYIDGGIADPMPVDVLEDLGVERIIAVNTIPTPAYLRCRMELDQEQAEVRGRRQPNKIRSLLNQYLNYFAPGNILDTILRSIHGAQMRVAEQSCLHADVVLRPLSFDGRWHDFRHPGKYIQIGRHEAEERLAEVKALINQHKPLHETRAPQNTVATVA